MWAVSFNAKTGFSLRIFSHLYHDSFHPEKFSCFRYTIVSSQNYTVFSSFNISWDLKTLDLFHFFLLVVFYILQSSWKCFFYKSFMVSCLFFFIACLVKKKHDGAFFSTVASPTSYKIVGSICWTCVLFKGVSSAPHLYNVMHKKHDQACMWWVVSVRALQQ